MADHPHDSAPPQTTLSEAVSSYLGSIAPDKRRRAGPELSRFARWCGGDRRIRSITPADVERYQQQTTQGRDPNDLQLLRDFFSYAREHEMTELPLAATVRIRRRAARAESTSKPVTAPPVTASREVEAPAAADQSVGLRCASCGEAERLRGKRQGEGITITCGACGNSWERDLRPTCRRCGRTDLIPEQRPLVDRVRGNQTAIVGGIVAYHCLTCDN
jgi:hypothetical protein